MSYNYLTDLLLISLALYAAMHALLNKADSRAAFGWIAISLLFPLFGPIMYFLFGVNRVHERAKKLEHTSPSLDYSGGKFLSEIPGSLRNIQHISYQLTKLPLVGGNRIDVLISGEQAYPAMLESINNAKKNVFLSTYIFKVDAVGQQFIAALIKANDRGVDVYVLIDGVGEHYSRVKARKILAKNRVKVAQFLPPKLLPFNIYINLRNHRKLLLIDDDLCFVGGMNISAEYMNDGLSSLKDIHFRVKGDIAHQLKRLFESDWRFTKGYVNNQKINSPKVSDSAAWCRTIIDGPGKNLGHLSIVLFSAINAATKSVVIMTPYFLPNKEITRALQVAALRGVNVSVVVPLVNNLNFVHWASRHMLAQLITSGVKIYYHLPPFDHSKIFVVDNLYSLMGSANIDPRSLRLNYEVGIEIYDSTLAGTLTQYANNAIKQSELVTLDELKNRNLLVKIRDAIAWLFSPYL